MLMKLLYTGKGHHRVVLLAKVERWQPVAKKLKIEPKMISQDLWEKARQMSDGFSQTDLVTEKSCVSLIQPH